MQTRRTFIGLLCFAFILSVCVFPSVLYAAQPDVQVDRIYGDNRFETTVEISKQGSLGMDTSTAYIATGNDFADALTGSVLAAKNQAPILLVNQQGIPAPIQTLLSTTEQAYVLGGTGAVGQSVLDQIQNPGKEPSEDEQRKVLTAQEIFTQNNEKVVLINTATGQGSGVIVSDGLILTNEHVVRDMQQTEITMSNGDKYEMAGIVEIDDVKDLALIKTKQVLDTAPVIFANTSNLLVGEDIVAIGSPLGLQNTLSTGIISGLRTFDGVKHIQITASITHGSSGGGLFNQYGELIGITTGVIGESGNLNFAVDISEIAPWHHHLDAKHEDIPIVEVPDIPDQTIDFIQMGMTKEEVKRFEETAVSTLFYEDQETLMYSGAYIYGLETGIMYSFSNQRLIEMTYFIEGTEYLWIDELETLFYYLLFQLEYDFGPADV